MPSDFLIEFSDTEGRRVVVDDDGVAAYAYLILPEKAGTSLVWLYNRADTPPLSPEWEAQFRDGTAMAPLNARQHVKEEPFEIPSENDIHVVWHPEDRSVAIYIWERLHAVLGEFESVGRCELAQKDGPVALSMESGAKPNNGRFTRGNRSLIQFVSGEAKVLIESDPRAAYAYLYRGTELVSYVWLFNRQEASETVAAIGPPGNRESNAKSLMVGEAFSEPNEEEIQAMLRPDPMMAGIYIRGGLHAILQEGHRPGVCVLAALPGPLALPPPAR